MITDYTDFTARMEKARDVARARSNRGRGAGPIASQVTDSLRRFREAGMNASDLGYEVVAAALVDFLAAERAEIEAESLPDCTGLEF